MKLTALLGLVAGVVVLVIASARLRNGTHAVRATETAIPPAQPARAIAHSARASSAAAERPQPLASAEPVASTGVASETALDRGSVERIARSVDDADLRGVLDATTQ